ncbi:hypothetical protein ACS0TY_031351 [Phlomoides rotata]
MMNGGSIGLLGKGFVRLVGRGSGSKGFTLFQYSYAQQEGWRILQKPNSLLSRTLQARYFRHQTFLSATVGYNPSFSWRSILEGREVLKLGLVWMVGNGCSINIWGDPWVRTRADPVLISPSSQPCDEVFVANLIFQNSRSWDQELISALFLDEIRDQILAIPIRQIDEEDFLMWKLERNGTYIVRSGYRAWVDFSDSVTKTENEHDIAMAATWHWIWGLPIPPKL